ncbi:MAG: flagellin [Deltaproteobacteria bacterium]|jgi:flagellin|nr:flagellin [Deltaproteobacteria bacterium]
MALIINHNMPAMIAARNLGTIYNNLGTSIERLSSGLRINSAADDAAGLAVRELMRADISTTYQGIRNAADALSMIQTADGALAVIDAKLTRMKELAEQAATGTYTTIQREIINSEYQAMAQEIDRIANATNFNGIKLLDGSLNSVNGGQGIRIHFGVGNNAAEDYYYVKTDDTRATSTDGLRIGGDGHNDIWSTGSYALPYSNNNLNGCCGGGAVTDPDANLTGGANAAFMFGYNWDGRQNTDSALLSAHYVAGRYGQGCATITLNELAAQVNLGTQSRVGIKITAALSASSAAGDYTVICIGEDEAYYVGSRNSASAKAMDSSVLIKMSGGTAAALTSAINHNSKSFWAMQEGSAVWVFAKDPGNHNDWEVERAGSDDSDKSALSFINAADNSETSAGGRFSMGGQNWGKMQVYQTAAGGYAVALLGRDVGNDMDLWIADSGDAVLTNLVGMTGVRVMSQIGRASFSEIQNASEGQFARGSHIRTQQAGQLALEAISEAITRKDVIRANLGSIANRLEATMENLTIQAENLQAAESRISDVDVATEMTEFTKNNILAQAATSMLAQANSLSSLALTLLR